MVNKCLSIVVSVYNEEKALNNFFKAFDDIKYSLSWNYELIFVNDGSVDNSLNLLKEYAQFDENVKIISFSKNYGHEAAMIAGIDHSHGDAVVCMDSDLQHPLESLNPIIDEIEKGYNVVSMVRTENKSAGLFKNITSKIFYKLINKLSNQESFEENASDFFAIDRKVVEVLKSSYRQKIRFLRGFVQNVGFKRTKLSYIASDRQGGESHYSIKNLIRLSINTIVCFSDIPLKLGIFAGGIAALFGVVVLIYSIFTHNGAPAGYTTLISFNSFMFAIMFVIIGVIGQYISAIYTEIKDKPIYIVEEMINFK
ncbi:MAG: glycosyltransferase family 2 protein [Clostridia bacterium]|nr:glycosyltransferase family 2 protein [Clostridia bacterium]